MSFGKRFLKTPAARALVGLLVRAYRPLLFGGVRLLVEPGLVRLLRTRAPAVFVCWHQDLVATVGLLSRFNARRRSYVLASASRDGGMAAAAAEALGFREAVRGSSAAQGASALRRLERFAGGERRSSIVFVGDGPRPPARVLKAGAVHLARESGLPIYLVRTSWWPDRALERTWARFHLVRPGTAGVALCEGPFLVPADADREALDRARAALEARLTALAARGDELARRRVIGP